jgi:hypothetical protein
MVINQYDDLGTVVNINLSDKEFNPEKNPDVIVIMKRKDGNYIGITQKDGKIIESREVSPQDALTKLLTHG